MTEPVVSDVDVDKARTYSEGNFRFWSPYLTRRGDLCGTGKSGNNVGRSAAMFHVVRGHRRGERPARSRGKGWQGLAPRTLASYQMSQL
jgi:hypothetical protein